MIASIQYCQEKCCEIKQIPYAHVYKKFKKNPMKMGVVAHDPKTSKVLLVQSRGNLWGFPKGSFDNAIDTGPVQCALREFREETGIRLVADDLEEELTVSPGIIYYYTRLQEQHVQIQNHIYGNDANGICWICPTCLKEMVLSGRMKVNRHCRILMKELFDIHLYKYPSTI